MTKQDKNFDDLFERFSENVYQGKKGAIRLHLLWKDLEAFMPHIMTGHKLRILDAGCGLGQLSARLAGMGHELVLCDISEKMLQQAEKTISQEAPGTPVAYIQCPIQELDSVIDGQFDMVLFHAVLEWLAEPEQTLKKTISLVKPGGHLSLMFYNVHSLVMRNLVRGNFRKIKNNLFERDPHSLTPLHPCDPEDVKTWLAGSDMRVITATGIRTFFDFMTRAFQENRSLEDVLEMEERFCKQEPYRSLGRYIHFLCERNE